MLLLIIFFWIIFSCKSILCSLFFFIPPFPFPLREMISCLKAHSKTNYSFSVLWIMCFVMVMQVCLLMGVSKLSLCFVVISWGDVSQSWSDVSHPLLLLPLSCYIGPNLLCFVVSKYMSIVDSQSIIVVWLIFLSVCKINCIF